MTFKKYFHQIRRFSARVWLEVNLQLTVIGVTGSYGKTSAVRAIAEALSTKYSVNRTDLNLDTVYNLPITILKTALWNEVLVLEYGVDHLGEMGQHLSLVKPKIAILTGITNVHTDAEHMGSLENVIAEKKKLVEAIPEDGLAIFNYDDNYCRKVGLEFKKRKIFYGMSRKADVWADNINLSISGTEFILHDGSRQLPVKTGLVGYPAVYSCLVACLVGKELKVDEEKLLLKLRTLGPLAGRFSVEKGPVGTILVNDSRRANFASTIFGLKSFTELPGRKVAVLGEMGEIGELEEEIHRKVGQELAKLKIDIVIGVGPLTKFILEEAEKNGTSKSQLFWANNVKEAALILKKVISEGDLLYLKASLLRHLERVIYLLEGKEVLCKDILCHRYQSCFTCPKFCKQVK